MSTRQCSICHPSTASSPSSPAPPDCAPNVSICSFALLGADCARAVAQVHATPLDDTAIGELAAAIRTLPAHLHAVPALTTLRQRGHRIVGLANSPQAVVDEQLRHAGLAALLDAVHSVERAGRLKPAPVAYQMALQVEGVEAGEAVMVATHDWDIAGAQAVGMRTVFVARGGRVPLPGWPAPDRVAADLVEATRSDFPHGP
jgi:2-haloacid dehalogenase